MRPLRTPHALASLLAAAAVLAAPAPSGAQADTGTTANPTPPWERRTAPAFALGGSALYQEWRRSGLDGGVGFDVYGSVRVSALALGAGYQRTEHRTAPAAGGATAVATYQGVFVEPRLLLGDFRNFTPYAVGRVAFLEQRTPAVGGFPGSSGRLTQYGAGLGTLVAVAPNLHLDLGAMYSALNNDRNADGARGVVAGRVGIAVGW